MFLSDQNSIALIETTVAQMMFQNVSREELISDFIAPPIITGVDVIPTSIDDYSCPRNVDTVLSEILVCKLFGAKSAIGTVATPAMVSALDIIKYRCSPFFPD